MKRRTFIQSASLTGAGIVTGATALSCNDKTESDSTAATPLKEAVLPVVIATWHHVHSR